MYRALWRVGRALLSVCSALLGVCRALSSVNKTLLRIFSLKSVQGSLECM